jgi:hypothetical protein
METSRCPICRSEQLAGPEMLDHMNAAHPVNERPDLNGQPRMMRPPDPFELAWPLVDAAIQHTRIAAESEQGIRIGHRIALAQMAATWALAVANRELMILQKNALEGAEGTGPPAGERPDLLAGLRDDPRILRTPGQ